MHSLTSQLDYLETFVSTLLDDHGFSEAPEELRNAYIPQFVTEAQNRMGAALMPKLSEEAGKELADMLNNNELTQEQLKAFWEKHVPDYEQIVALTLDQFATEVGEVLAEIRTSQA